MATDQNPSNGDKDATVAAINNHTKACQETVRSTSVFAVQITH